MSDDLDPTIYGDDDAQPWLERLERADKKMSAWQTAADNIDKQYASMENLRNGFRDREFQLFWANIQIMAPSIYARTPVPAVTPKFNDKRPIHRTTAEFLERAASVSIDLSDMDQAMLELRDDLILPGRGAGWVRYESEDGDRICYEHVDREDFRHDPARKWSEVDWAARRAWMTPDEMKKRFGADKARDVTYGQSRDERHDRSVGVWELWCKSEDIVVWVTEGHPEVLDRDEPHLKLAGFFPCPRPAYATCERRSLVPVPDMLFYKDQLEEINDITRRIHALSEAIKVRGFYAGGGDIGAAIETALKLEDDAQILIPVPNLGAIMQGGGDPIVWLPVQVVAETITGMIALRRQLFEDVYQITGLSDIMRGMTDAGETLGAQQLKQQNGNYRVRDKQNEMVRIARDMVRIGAEIMATEFSPKALQDMAQMELPTDAEAKKALRDLEKQATEAIKGAAKAAKEGDPEQAEQAFMQAQEQIVKQFQPQLEKAGNAVTIDQVMKLLRDEKLRPFILDIETDSTIYPDEMAEKSSRAEFMNVFTQAMQTVAGAMQAGPEAVSLAGGVFKFALAPYRVGRELEALIDDLVSAGPQIAERMSEGGEETGLGEAQMALAQAEMAKAQSQTEANQANAQLKMQELQIKGGEAQAKAGEAQQKFALEVEKSRGDVKETEARIEKIYAEIQKMGIDVQDRSRTQDREDAKTTAAIVGQQMDRVATANAPQQPVTGGPPNGRQG